MKEKSVLRSFAMVSQIGISMMVPIFLCAALGYWLDGQFHRQYFFLIMLLLGVGAAFKNLFVLTKRFYARESANEQEKLRYMEELRHYHEKHPEEDFSHVMEGKKKRYPDPKGPTRS